MKKIKIKLRSMVIGAITGGIIGAALILSAFAFSDTDASDSSRVVQEMKDDGSYITAQAAELDTLVADDEAAADDAADAEDVIRNVEVIRESKDYLSDMTPEEIKSLSVEALSGEGLDASLADGSLVTKGITFDLPEGFEAEPGREGMYVTSRYPIDASNVIYSEFDEDYTLQLMDKDYFEEMTEASFASAYGTPVDVTISEYTTYTIDGVPAFRIVAEYDLEDNHVTSTVIAVNGSRTYTLIYTMTHDYDRSELFEASIESIHVVK